MEHKKERRSMRKDEKGFTGLEAAIVLTAFIVVAAVFSYVVLNAGFFTTEKAKEVVHTGVATATSAVSLAGDLIGVGDTTAKEVDYLLVPLKLAAGGGSVQIGVNHTDSELDVSFLDNKTYKANCVWTRTWTEKRDTNDILDYGEKVELNITVPTAAAISMANDSTDREFTIEIRPVEGAVLSLAKRTPSAITKYMAMY